VCVQLTSLKNYGTIKLVNTVPYKTFYSKTHHSFQSMQEMTDIKGEIIEKCNNFMSKKFNHKASLMWTIISGL
jgi:hypothetical protein